MSEYTQSIYILLTRTGSLLSRVIAWVTRAAYTHAALSLDDEFEEMYSFTRRNPRYILPAGFARENLRRGLYRAKKETPCRVYRLRVTQEEYDRICEQVHSMFRDRKRYHYNFLGVAANYFGRRHSSPHRFFCSEFVASMMMLGDPEAVICPGRTRPMDFMEMPQLECVYIGSTRELSDRIDSHREARMKLWEGLSTCEDAGQDLPGGVPFAD